VIADILLIIMLVVLLATLPGFLAWKTGRSFGLWWLYGVVLLPVALVHAIVLGRGGFGFNSRPCPYCRTPVGVDALHCGRCGYDFENTGR